MNRQTFVSRSNSPSSRPLDFRGPTDIAFEAFEAHWIELPIMERFKVIAERHPNKIAVDDGTIQLTYSQLERAATHLAGRIDANVAPSASVGILIQNNSRFQIGALACLSVGRICVPIDLNYPIDRIEQISREAGLAAVVTGHADPVLNAPPHLPQLDIANLARGYRSHDDSS